MSRRHGSTGQPCCRFGDLNWEFIKEIFKKKMKTRFQSRKSERTHANKERHQLLDHAIDQEKNHPTEK